MFTNRNPCLKYLCQWKKGTDNKKKEKIHVFITGHDNTYPDTIIMVT